MKRVKKRLAKFYYDFNDNLACDFHGDINELIHCIYLLKFVAKEDFKIDLG